MASFKIGDLVELKSGGPTMTVEAIDPKWVKCSWFDGKKPLSQVFAPDALKAPEKSHWETSQDPEQ